MTGRPGADLRIWRLTAPPCVHRCAADAYATTAPTGLSDTDPMIVDLDMKKWIDRQHYRMDAEYLGRDEFGSWVAVPAGTPIRGPTGNAPLWYSFVTLIPDEAWWVASWNDERDINHGLYVDTTTVSRWIADDHVTCVDLDLDVIQRRDGTVFLDDEDEFIENRVKYGYPDDIVAGAEVSARWIVEAVTSQQEPFGDTGLRWLERVAGVS